MNIGIISLGCAKNRVDSETIAYLFKDNDVNIVQDFSSADILSPPETKQSNFFNPFSCFLESELKLSLM